MKFTITLVCDRPAIDTIQSARCMAMSIVDSIKIQPDDACEIIEVKEVK